MGSLHSLEIFKQNEIISICSRLNALLVIWAPSVCGMGVGGGRGVGGLENPHACMHAHVCMHMHTHTLIMTNMLWAICNFCNVFWACMHVCAYTCVLVHAHVCVGGHLHILPNAYQPIYPLPSAWGSQNTKNSISLEWIEIYLILFEDL